MRILPKLLFFAASLFTCAGISSAAVSTIVLSGQPAPGVANASFSSLSRARINNSGEIAFRAGLSNGAYGIFKQSAGQLSLVALTGASAAGLPGLTFGSFSDPVINDSGVVAFSSLLSGGSTRLVGIFMASGTTVTLVADTNTPIPGTGGQTLSADRAIKIGINSKGDMALLGTLSGDTVNSLLLITNGAISKVISDAIAFSFNNRDEIAYLAADGKICLFSGGTTQLIAQRGQSVPNTDITLDVLQSPELNDDGAVVFINGATFYDGRFYHTVRTAVIEWRGGLLQKIAALDDAVPNSGAAAFSDFLEPLIDNSGATYFLGRLSTDSSYGIFRFLNGNLSLMGQEGQTIEGVGKFTFMGEADVNDRGTGTFVSNIDNGSFGIFQFNTFLNPFFFPEVANGTSDPLSWHTTLMLSNSDSSGSASVSVRFYCDDGTPMNVGIQNVTDSVFTFTIPASGSLNLETEGQGSLKTGWALLEADKTLSGISIFSSYDRAGKYVGEVGAPAVSGQSSFALFVAAQADINAAVSIANPNSMPASVTLILRDSQGSILGSSLNWLIPSKGRKAKYLTELFPQIPDGFRGTIEAVSSVPVIPMGMRQRQLVFTWLPLNQ